MTLIPVTLLVPESFLSQLLASGVKVQVLPEKGQKMKAVSKRPESKMVTHHAIKKTTASPKRSSPRFPQRPNFLGGRTPSQLFDLYQRPPKVSHRKRLLISEPCHRPGYVTASQLLVMSLHPLSKGGKKAPHYPTEKDALSPSRLFLAYKKQGHRPELFKGLTASQLLVQHDRIQSRSSNYKKYMSARLYPTPSQLFNLAESNKPAAQPPKKPSGQKPAQPKKQQAKAQGQKQQMIQRMNPLPEPRSLLEPTPSMLLLKHLSMIPSLGDQKKKAPQIQQKPKPVVKKQMSQREMERNEAKLEPFLYGF